MHTKLLAKNKKTYFDYEVIEKYETGIILTGAEVKSAKEGHLQLKGSYAVVEKNRVFAQNIHISPYRYAQQEGYDPVRKRELLLKKKEISYLSGLSVQKGYTLIPLEVYAKNSLVKVLLGVCRGKKAHDKRNVLKKRAMIREIDQGLKKFSH